VYSAEYDVDSEIAGITRTPPYSLVWDTFYAANGAQHSASVTYRDILNNVIAASPPLMFGVENDLPQHTCPPNGSVCTDISVTAGEVVQVYRSSASSAVSNALSFHGAGAVAQVGAVHSVQNASAGSLTTASFSPVTGHLIAVYSRWQGTGTITCSDPAGNPYSYATLQSSGTSFSGQWCYAANISGFTSGGVTVTVSTNVLIDVFAIEVSGASTTSPLDVNVTSTGSFAGTANPTSPVLTLGFPAGNEFILAGCTWAGAQAATGSAGYIFTESSSLQSAIQTINPPAGWYGALTITITANGDNAGISKSTSLMVDGLPIATLAGYTSASTTFLLNTGQFTNGPHRVVATVSGGNCPGCVSAAWSLVGQWELQQTFTSGAYPNQLVGSWRDIRLCVTPSLNCPSSTQLTASILYSDGSTTAVANPTFTPSTTTQLQGETVPFSVASAGATATVTATSTNGAGFIVIKDPVTNFSRTVWVYVQPSVNNYPHFLSDGTFATSYTAGTAHSIWNSILYGGQAAFAPVGAATTSTAFNYAAQFGSVLGQAFHGFDASIPAWDGSSTAAGYQTQAQNIFNKYASWASPFGLSLYLTGYSIMTGTDEVFNEVYGPPSQWAVPPLSYFLSLVPGSGVAVTGFSGIDEVSSKWPANPLLGTDTGGVKLGISNGPSQIACTAGTTCTISWTGWSLVGSNRFLITGSGTNLDYNTASGTPSTYQATTVNANSFTFPTPAGVGTSTFTSSTSPNLRIEPMVNNVFDATALTGPVSGANSCPPGYGAGASSPGPCTQYIHYDALQKLRAQVTGVSGHTPLAIPSLSGVFGTPVSWWCGKFANLAGVKMSDYCEAYFTQVNTTYLAQYDNLQDLIAGQEQQVRLIQASMDLGTPLEVESAATTLDYLIHGTAIPIASCSGSTITTASPHGVFNVLPDNTRISVSGSSGANCDGKYYIIAAPTATTLTVALANATISGATSGGTITFANGNTWGLSNWAYANPGSNQEGSFDGAGDSTCPNTWKVNRGQRFTLSGTSNSALNAVSGIPSFWFTADTLNACPSPGQGGQAGWRQMANITASTGGAGSLTLNDRYQRGSKWQVNSETGPRYQFASDNIIAILGGAGNRGYSYTNDPDLVDLTLTGVNNGWSSPWGGLRYHFDDLDFNIAVQGQINPFQDVVKSQIGWFAHSVSNMIQSRLIKYSFQQQLPSPDYGVFFESAARSGPFGNLLMVQSFADNAVSCTANLTPYLVAGQTIIRISGTGQSGIEPITVLAAGTTSDTMTCQPGEFRAYLFPKNTSAEIQLVPISARLADVGSAVKVVVQLAYNPLAFASSVSSQSLFQTFDCGTGTCTLPVDRQIGQVYYRLFYLDPTSNVLATSDIQSF
jgi:hypothetical protein